MVIIPVEIGAREAWGKVALRKAFQKKGIHAITGPRAYCNWLASQTKNNLIFHDGAADRNDRYNMLNKFHKNNHKIILMDTEGLFYSYPKIFDIRYPEKFKNGFDAAICWGPKVRRLIEKKFPDYGGHLLNLGNPQFIFWKDKTNQAKYKIIKHNKYNLWNTSFPRVNPRYKHTLNSSIKDKNIDMHVKRNFDFFIEALLKIAREFPEKNNFLRMHPNEDENNYKKIIKKSGLTNIFFANSYGSFDWIIGAENVFAHNCTTIVEAEICGKNHFNLALDNNFQNKEISTVSKPIDNISELLTQINGRKKNVQMLNFLYHENIDIDLFVEKITLRFQDFINENNSKISRYKKCLPSLKWCFVNKAEKSKYDGKYIKKIENVFK